VESGYQCTLNVGTSEPGIRDWVLRIRDVYPVSNKILHYLSSEVIKKILVNFQRIIELFV